jgi:hypothetical protein
MQNFKTLRQTLLGELAILLMKDDLKFVSQWNTTSIFSILKGFIFHPSLETDASFDTSCSSVVFGEI